MALNPCQLVVLTKFFLPTDYARRVGFEKALKAAASGRPLQLPRFCGYYFSRNAQPVGLCRHGCADLPLEAPIAYLPVHIYRATKGEFAIVPKNDEARTEYLLVHDGWDGSCCLQRFDLGFRFLTAKEPVLPP